MKKLLLLIFLLPLICRGAWSPTVVPGVTVTSATSPNLSGTGNSYTLTYTGSNTPAIATSSGTTPLLTSTSAIVASSLSSSATGNAQNVTVGMSGTSNYITAPEGSTVLFDGDSITISPNGLGYTSWASILSGMSFFKNSTYINSAVGGSLLTNGSTAANGSPETATATWPGVTGTINLTSTPSTPGGYPIAGAMSVTGTNIPFGTTGVLTSGTILTLSQATTGSSGGSVTVRLGGNNVLDRWASQIYPHRPAAYGGSGGAGPVYHVVMATANDNNASVTGTAQEAAFLQLAALDGSNGITIIYSTTLPDGGQAHWSYAQDLVRQAVNHWIVSGSGAQFVVDSCEAFGGNPAELPDGTHPAPPANQRIADYWNAKLQTGPTDVLDRQWHDSVETFQQGIAFNPTSAINNAGFGITASTLGTGNYFPIAWPNMTGTQIAQISVGKDDGIPFDDTLIGMIYYGTEFGNNLSFFGNSGVTPTGGSGGNPFFMNTSGEASLGTPVSGLPAVNSSRLFVQSYSAEIGGDFYNASTTGGLNILSALPNLGNGALTVMYGFQLGQGSYSDPAFDGYHVANNSSANAIGFRWNSESVSNWWAFGTGDTQFGVDNWTTDYGFTIYDSGSLKVIGSTTLSTTNALLKTGTGGLVAPAVAGTDYLAPGATVSSGTLVGTGTNSGTLTISGSGATAALIFTSGTYTRTLAITGISP